MNRSTYWTEVAPLVERSRRRYERFEPEGATPEVCLQAGVEPIVSLYVAARSDGAELSTVELSLLDGALNDWLKMYARCRNTRLDGQYSVHEVAIDTAKRGDLGTVVDELVCGPQ